MVVSYEKADFASTSTYKTLCTEPSTTKNNPSFTVFLENHCGCFIVYRISLSVKIRSLAFYLLCLSNSPYLISTLKEQNRYLHLTINKT